MASSSHAVQTPPSPPTPVPPWEQRHTPGRTLPHRWPRSPSRPPSGRLLPRPALTGHHGLREELKARGRGLLSAPDASRGVRAPGPPRVPELTEGRVPALKPKPKPDVLVPQHLHAPPHPPGPESTPRKPHSVNPAAVRCGPGAPAPGINTAITSCGRTCSHRHPRCFRWPPCFLLCRCGAPASCCDLQGPTDLSQLVPEPGHTDAGRTYLTQATPERAQGTYLWPHGVPESWVWLVSSRPCRVLSRSCLG